MDAIVSLVILLLVTEAGASKHANLPAAAAAAAAVTTSSRTMSPMEYWQAVLPETPMPRAIDDLLTQSTGHTSLDDKAAVQAENIDAMETQFSSPQFIGGDENIFMSNGVKNHITLYGPKDKDDARKVTTSYTSGSQKDPRKTTVSYGSQGDQDPRKISVSYGSQGDQDPRKISVSYGSQVEKDSRKVTTSYGSQGKDDSRKVTMSYRSQGQDSRKVTTAYEFQGEKDSRKVTTSYGSQSEDESRKVTPSYRSQGDGSRKVTISYGSHGEEDSRKVTTSYGSQGEGSRTFTISYESQGDEDSRKVTAFYGSQGLGHDHVHSHNDGGNKLADVFFFHDVLRPGSVITPTIPTTTSLPSLLPRRKADSLPFSTKRFDDILAMFAPASIAMADEIRWTLDTCEHPRPLPGEKAGCATSLESLAKLAAALLGTRNVRAFSGDMPIDPAGTTALRGRHNVTAVRRLSESTMAAACHDLTYPYAVFYCHTTTPAATYLVTLAAEDGSAPAMQALAVCHLDTSLWSPRHPFLQVHNLKPGDVAVCHFLSKLSIIWVQAGEQGGAREAR